MSEDKNPERPNRVTYADSGVNIAAADTAVERIKQQVRSTFRPEVLGDLGGFGGLFSFPPDKFKDPVLVSTTDGVGTKSVIAHMTGRYDTIGIDLVAASVDDLVCQGAEPLFFLDYISVGQVDPDQIEQLVQGVAEGCRQSGVALIGGEISEHPGILQIGEFDFVGFGVGVVEREKLITSDNVNEGDVLIGLPSPGLRCNGYSMARKVLFELADRGLDEPAYPDAAHSLAEELLKPSVIYAPAVASLLESVQPHAIAHITGGGIFGNVARILPSKYDAVIDPSRWERPPIFTEIQKLGNVDEDEMYNVFNLGIGMVIVVDPADCFSAIDHLRSSGQRAIEIGIIAGGDGLVRLESDS